MISPELATIIKNYPAGAVASINDDGSPSVSPKATFVVINDVTLAFGDIRSPGTVANLKLRPQTEINFIDVLCRRAARIKGTARIIPRGNEEWDGLTEHFQKPWAPYIELMRNFVVIDVTHASVVTSPAYDIGMTQEQLRETNLEKLKNLAF